MDTKEFERLQQGVQWVADEYDRRDTGGEDLGGPHHDQELWGTGTITSTIRLGLLPYGEGVMEVPVVMVCPSTCCLAGNIVLAAGDQFIVPEASSDGPGKTCEVDRCIDAEGQVWPITTRAQELAGLSSREAQRLFDGENEPSDIVTLAANVADEHGYELNII